MGPQTVIFKVIGCTIIIIVNCLGVFLPIFYTDWFFVKNGIKKYNCLLAGILFSSAISQMLAESEKSVYIDNDGPDFGFPLVHFCLGIGFCVSMAMQFLIDGIKRHKHNNQALKNIFNWNRMVISVDSPDLEEINGFVDVDDTDQPNLFTLFAIFTFENMLTGIALGVQTAPGVIMVLSLSTAATDWIESVLFCMALSISFGKKPSFKKMAVKYALAYTLMSAITTIFWVALMSNIEVTTALNNVSGLVMAFLSGTFIYISCKDILAKEIDETEINGRYPNLKDMINKVIQFTFGFVFVNGIVLVQSLV